MSACEWCGVAIPEGTGHRVRRFCSRSCKNSAGGLRQRAEQLQALDRRCLQCGGPITHGSKARTLCSRECTLARRSAIRPKRAHRGTRKGACCVCGAHMARPANGRPRVTCSEGCEGRWRRGEGAVRVPAPAPSVEEWLAERRPRWAREGEQHADAWAGYSSMGGAGEATW